MDQVEAARANLLMKLGTPAHALPDAEAAAEVATACASSVIAAALPAEEAVGAGAGGAAAAADDARRPQADEEAAQLEELRQLEAEVRTLHEGLDAEESRLERARGETALAAEELAEARSERRELERRLKQHRRREERQQSSSKLVQFQLAVATQLEAVGEHLARVPAAYTSHDGWMPEALREREREVDELRRALKRQQQLVGDAHRQLLELATRRKPLGAASATAEPEALRVALAEQELARMRAEARADELQAQVRLLEEQGLRLRLHLPPVPSEGSSKDRPAPRVILPREAATPSA